MRRDALRVDGDRRARVPARRGRPSAERIGIRRAAGRAAPASSRVVAVVEVAAPRAGGSRADAGISSAARATRRRSTDRTPSSWRSRSRRSRRCSASRGEPLLTRVYRFERASAQHEVGHLARMAAIDRGPGAASRAVHDRQRLPRRRHSRLRRRRARDGETGIRHGLHAIALHDAESSLRRRSRVGRSGRAQRAPRRPPTPTSQAAAADQGRRQRSARGVGGGRPLPARDGRVERREARARDRRRARLQRDLDGPRPAADRRPADDHRVRPGARAERRPPTSAAPASPTS